MLRGLRLCFVHGCWMLLILLPSIGTARDLSALPKRQFLHFSFNQSKDATCLFDREKQNQLTFNVHTLIEKRSASGLAAAFLTMFDRACGTMSAQRNLVRTQTWIELDFDDSVTVGDIGALLQKLARQTEAFFYQEWGVTLYYSPVEKRFRMFLQRGGGLAKGVVDLNPLIVLPDGNRAALVHFIGHSHPAISEDNGALPSPGDRQSFAELQEHPLHMLLSVLSFPEGWVLWNGDGVYLKQAKEEFAMRPLKSVIFFQGKALAGIVIN